VAAKEEPEKKTDTPHIKKSAVKEIYKKPPSEPKETIKAYAEDVPEGYVIHKARWRDTPTRLIKKYQHIDDALLINKRLAEFKRDNMMERPEVERDFISFPGGRIIKVIKDKKIIHKYVGGEKSSRPDGLTDGIICGKIYKIRTYI